jgi:hypothetical protein
MECSATEGPVAPRASELPLHVVVGLTVLTYS